MKNNAYPFYYIIVGLLSLALCLLVGLLSGLQYAVPDFIKESDYFTGNDLGKLGNIENIPTEEEIAIFVKENFEVKAVLSADDMDTKFQKAKEYVDNGRAIDAWKLLLAKK